MKTRVITTTVVLAPFVGLFLGTTSVAVPLASAALPGNQSNTNMTSGNTTSSNMTSGTMQATVSSSHHCPHSHTISNSNSSSSKGDPPAPCGMHTPPTGACGGKYNMAC